MCKTPYKNKDADQHHIRASAQDVSTGVLDHQIKIFMNPFKPNGISHRYQTEQSISILRDVGWYFSILFNFLKNILQANNGDPDQTPRSVASGLDLHYLHFVP